MLCASLACWKFNELLESVVVLTVCVLNVALQAHLRSSWRASNAPLVPWVQSDLRNLASRHTAIKTNYTLPLPHTKHKTQHHTINHTSDLAIPATLLQPLSAPLALRKQATKRSFDPTLPWQSHR